MTLVDSPPITRRPGEFNPSEIAAILAGGIEYTSWETVWAQERWGEAFSFFRFTTAEASPMPEVYSDLKIIPCMPCTITLGGSTAITGWVMQRQVAYDAERHQVMIIGKAATFWPAKSHIKTEDANMDGLNIVQIANKLVGPYGVTVTPIGDVDMKPFEKLQADPGGNIWEFLEKQSRDRRTILSSNAAGQLLLVGPHGVAPVGVLEEGVNIKKMQAVISIEDTWLGIQVLGQVSGSDQQNMGDANDMKGEASGTSCIKAELVFPVEHPVQSKEELDQRAHYEALWTDGAKITANVTVQGWFNPSGGLWRAGQQVMVKSPMVYLNQELKVKTCTWTQDSENGTETLLECVQPWALNGMGGANVADPPPAPSSMSINPVPQVTMQDLTGLGPVSPTIGRGGVFGGGRPDQPFPPPGSIGGLPPEAATRGRGWPTLIRPRQRT